MSERNRGRAFLSGRITVRPDGVQATQHPARLIHHADNRIMYGLDAKWNIHAEHQVDRITVVFQ